MAEITKIKELSFRNKDQAEPDWLYDQRRSGWVKFQRTPLPDRVEHLWRYTKPEYFLTDDVEGAMRSYRPLSPAEVEEKEVGFDDYAGFGTVQADGIVSSALLEELVEKGIFFGSLQEASEKHPDIIENHLGKLVGADFGKFEAMNTALWSGGLMLYVPDNVELDRPMFILRDIMGSASFTRLLAVFGRNSRATLIDNYGSSQSSEGGVVNGITEIFADDYSKIRYVNMQNLPKSYNSFITERARIGKESSIYSIYGGIGSGISKVDVGTYLAGTAAESKMYGVVFADENQHFDYHTVHHHQAAESYSDIDFKVILKDKATSAYTGLIRIDEDTKNCQAYQINRNLLLNKGPKAESIPELEILTDEVQCSHGATMGPIDPEMMFYLKSRGFNEPDAVRMIIEGFVEPTAAQLPEELGDTMRKLILTKLEG